MMITVNGQRIDLQSYASFHRERFATTLALVRSLGGGRTVEVGGHPWAMTEQLLRDPNVNLCATVSAEEVTAWPDQIPLRRQSYELNSSDGFSANFFNYSANIERTLFKLDEPVDLVLACEVVEHLTRAPHVMMLNINSWLPIGGRVILTTPNGAQFENPLRVKAKMPALRFSSYSRHNFVFTLPALVDLAQTCGFEIERADYWSPYTRSGPARLYRSLARFNSPYLKAKFSQTVVVVGRKVEDRAAASRLPIAYYPSPYWEYMDQVAVTADADPKVRRQPSPID